MLRIMKAGDGEYYVYKNPHNFKDIKRNWWLGLPNIGIGKNVVYVPKELQGKRLMFRVVVLKDKEETKGKEVEEDELDENLRRQLC